MNIRIILKAITFILIFLAVPLAAMEVIIQGQINEEYDDNINTSSSDPQSDWLTNIMLGMAISSDLRTIDIDLSGNIYQQLSLQDSSRNLNFQDLNLSVNKSFSETTSVSIVDMFQHYPETRSFEVLFGRNEADTGYLSNNLSLNLVTNIFSRLILTCIYHNNIMNNDSDNLSDSILHNAGGEIGYLFNTANIFSLGYTYQLMIYDDGNKSRADSGYAEYEKYFTSQLRAVVLGGYNYIDSDDGQSLNTRWLASLIDDVDRNNNLNISFVKEKIISNIMNDILDQWTASVMLTREISLRTGISIRGFYGQGSYQISGVKDKLFGVTTNLNFAVTEFVSFTAGYTYTRNSSKTPGIGENVYNRNQFSVGLTGVY